MVTLKFPVSFGYSDTDVYVKVSNKDAALLKACVHEGGFGPKDYEEPSEAARKIEKRIRRALADQLDDDEDIDVDDIDFFFGFPKF